MEKIIQVPNFTIGTSEDRNGITGVTVIRAPLGGATASVDVRGYAPGTRETDVLAPERTVEKIHAVVLSGGSAFGLEAASGCMKYLAEQGIGFSVGTVCVPIVSAAVLFDLMIGSEKAYPTVFMGYEATRNASNRVPIGSTGAGVGATVGKLFGFDRAMKSGAGYYEVHLPKGVKVGAYVAVNACGEVYDRKTVIAGARSKDGRYLESCHEYMLSGGIRELRGANTTIACIITNAKLTKSECKVVSSMAHDGYARAIRPVHTTMDGDTIFTMASGEVESAVDTIGYAAQEAIRRAIIEGTMAATSLGGYLAYQDINI